MRSERILCLLIADNLLVAKLLKNLLQVLLANDVWCDDELPLRMLVEIADENIFVRRPATACDKDFGRVTNEGLYDRQLLRLLLYLKHTVEARIASNSNAADANLSQQLAALLVLHEEVGEAVEHTAVLASVPAEEDLIRTEDTRHTVDRHVAVLEDVEVVIPELVLDEERHHRTYRTEEADGIDGRVKGQIADDVGTLIVLAHLIARRREERQQNLVVRMLATQLFHEWTALLELTQRGSMKPHIARRGVYLLLQHAESSTLTTPHLAHLLVEEAVDGDAVEVEVNNDVIYH